MKFKYFVKTGLLIVSLVLMIVTLMTLSVFALKPTTEIYMTAILLTMLLMQVMTIALLMHIHDALTAKRGRKK